jgi:hypothetical protein
MYRKSICLALSSIAVIAALALPSQGRAGVNVNISVNGPPLPAYVVPAPPHVIPVPGTYVYVAPDLGVDMLFYGGFWYRPYEGRWYQARAYNGPWVYVAPTRVPRAIATLPPGYRGMAHGHDRIPYGQLKKNWARWERERHWESRPEWRDHGPRPQAERGWDRGRPDQRGPGPDHGRGEQARGPERHGGPGERDWDRGDHRGR